jgi:hypothetical protein
MRPRFASNFSPPPACPMAHRALTCRHTARSSAVSSRRGNRPLVPSPHREAAARTRKSPTAYCKSLVTPGDSSRALHRCPCLYPHPKYGRLPLRRHR